MQTNVVYKGFTWQDCVKNEINQCNNQKIYFFCLQLSHLNKEREKLYNKLRVSSGKSQSILEIFQITLFCSKNTSIHLENN